MKLLLSANKKNEKQKKILRLKLLEVILVQCNLVGNHYQQKSQVAYTFISNKSHAYLLKVESSNLVILTICNTEFDNISKTFMYQNGR